MSAKIDRKLYASVIRDFNEGMKAREGQEKIWRDAEDMVYGNHWKGSNMPRHKSRVVVNTPFEVIETMLPVITARDPRVEVQVNPTPELVADPKLMDQVREYAEGLGREFKEIWDDSYMKRKNRERFRQMKIYGNGIIKSVKVPGEQRIEAEVCDVFSIVPAPKCYNIRECEGAYLIHAPLLRVSDIKRRWNLNEVKPDGDREELVSHMFADQVNDDRAELLSPVGDTAGERFEQLEERGEAGSTDEAYAYVIERWAYDDSVDENGDMLYPTGRLTAVTKGAPDFILYDGPNPYEHFPFFMTKNYSEAKSFWGRPDSRQTNTLIKTRNMIVSQMTDWLRLTANPTGTRVRGSGVKLNQVTNEPGSVIDSNMPGGFQWNNPPQLHIANAIAFLGYIDAKEDNILGIQDAWRGRSSGASESGAHADLLRNQSAGRMQPAVEEMVESIREMGEHWLQIIKTMWGEEKIHETVNRETGETEYKEFLGILAAPEARLLARDIDTRIKIEVGSMMEQDKRAEYEQTVTILTTQWPSAEAGKAAVDAAPDIRDKKSLKNVIDGMFQQAQGNGPLPDGGQIPPDDLKVLQSTDKQAIFDLLRQHPEYQQMIEGK